MSETSGLDREALEAAADKYRLGEGTPYPAENIVRSIIAAYFGALEPVRWEAEDKEHGWVRGLFRSREQAEDEASLGWSTGRIRGLYPGPIQETSRE